MARLPEKTCEQCGAALRLTRAIHVSRKRFCSVSCRRQATRLSSEELYERFNDSFVPEALTGCWLWIGNANRQGYGLLVQSRRTKMAHRYSFESFVGPIPAGLVIDHKCRNPACVNPDHLRAVTQRENVMASEGITSKNSRKTSCGVCGGDYHVNSNGFRACRPCLSRRARECYARKKARCKS